VSDEQDRMECDDERGNTGDKRGADDMAGEGEDREMVQGRENEQEEIEGGNNGSEDDSDSDANTQNASSGIPVC